eukprot:3681972-Heterocapsa_arctica.AAC.1
MVGMGAGCPVLLLRSQPSSQGLGRRGNEFHCLSAGSKVLANILALGYTPNLAESMIGAWPVPLAAASSLLLRPLPPPRFCACLGTLGAP